MSEIQIGTVYSFMSNAEKAAYRKKGYYPYLVSFLLFSLIIWSCCFISPSLEKTYFPFWSVIAAVSISVQAVLWYLLVCRYKDIVRKLRWEGLNTKFTLPPSHIFCKFLGLGCPIGLFIKSMLLFLDAAINNAPEYIPYISTMILLDILCLVLNIISTCMIKK